MNYCIKEDKSNKRDYIKDVKVGGIINMVLFLLFKMENWTLTIDGDGMQLMHVAEQDMICQMIPVI